MLGRRKYVFFFFFFGGLINKIVNNFNKRYLGYIMILVYVNKIVFILIKRGRVINWEMVLYRYW